jgi:hypothetical protein
VDCCPRNCWALLALALAACSVGEGQGELTAAVVVSDFCELEDPALDLNPTFFAGEVTLDQLVIRVQRGSQVESESDGLIILVRDVNEIKRQRIGLPIPIDSDERSLVQVVLYLNGTCPVGFPDEFGVPPVVLEAASGEITFRHIYAPELDSDSTGIEAEISGVEFADVEMPEQRHATLDGWFSFFYQRGAPAQRFP